MRPALRGMRGLAALVALGLVTVLVLALSAGAARTPTMTAVIVCSSSLSYTDPYSAPDVGIWPATGGGERIVCPSGGGRFRVKLPLYAATDEVRVSCWNGTISLGDQIGTLPFSGECVDPYGYGTFAKFTVR